MRIDLHARPLHPGEHARHRPLQRLVNGAQMFARHLRFKLAPQPERDISILGRIARGRVERHLIKRDLVFAAAADVGKLDRRMAQMALAQIIHAMPMQARGQHIRHQHRIVDRADIEAIFGEHGQIEFDVLANFQDRWVFQHWLQGRNHFGQRQLLQARCGRRLRRRRCKKISDRLRLLGVADRDVTGLIRPQRQRNPHQIGADHIKAVGFGVDADFAGGCDPRDPVGQRSAIGDGAVSVAIDWGIVHVRRSMRHGRQNRAFLGDMLAHAPGDGVEFHVLQECEQRGVTEIAHSQRLQRRFNRNVILERHQQLGHADLRDIVLDRFAALGLFDFAGPRDDGLQIAKHANQLGGGFRPDARRAGHIVDAVAHQGLDIDHLVGRDAELFLHGLQAKRLGLHRVKELDLAGHDQLHQILVGRHDLHFRAASCGLASIGGDQIVGLIAFHIDRRHAEGARCIADQRKLRDQVFRRRRALGLVGGVELLAKRLFGLVENHREMGWPFARLHVFEQFEQHVAKAADCADGQTVTRARQRRQRMIGAKNIARAVDQKKPRGGIQRYSHDRDLAWRHAARIPGAISPKPAAPATPRSRS